MEPLVSVIVPIYKVELYLRKCVDSILAQTYQNLEILLVDDGSPDECPRICDAYKEKDSRVKVIHKSNGGLSDARNAGLDAATGEYVTFIDGDDFYAPETVERLMSAIGEEGADVVSYGACIVRENDKQGKAEDPRYEKNSFCEYLEMIFLRKYSPSVCTKLYKRTVIGENRFLKGRLNEDFYFSSLLFLGDGTVVTVPFVGYYYFQREGSISHSGVNNKSVQDAVLNCMEIQAQVAEQSAELLPALAQMAFHQASVLIRIIPEKRITKDNEKLVLSCACIRMFKEYRKQSGIGAYEGAIVCCADFAPVLTARVLRFVRRILR